MYILSRKVKRAIDANLGAMASSTFTETNVKELLIDIRELCREIQKAPGSNPSFDATLSDFLDVCDCIAHPNRDRGVIERHIRAFMDKLHSAFETTPNERLENVTIDTVLSGDALVAALLATVFRYLYAFNSSMHREQVEQAFAASKDDIALCIISLLQDVSVELRAQEGTALLSVICHDEKYRLYCRVLNSRIEQDARVRTHGEGRVILGFPVIVTNARRIDDVDQIASESSTQYQAAPPIIETFRDSENRLRVRIVQEASIAG